MTRVCMHVHVCGMTTKQKYMDTRCVQMYLVLLTRFFKQLKASIWCTLRAKLRDLWIHLSDFIFLYGHFTNHSPFKLYCCLLITTFFYCHIVFYTSFYFILLFLYNYNDHIKMCLYLTGCRKSFLSSLA